MAKGKTIKITRSKGKVVYEFENTLKMRIPVPKCGGRMSDKRDKKSVRRPKITKENYESYE